jgi:hypothetical protein
MANKEEDKLTEIIDRLYDLQNYPFTPIYTRVFSGASACLK